MAMGDLSPIQSKTRGLLVLSILVFLTILLAWHTGQAQEQQEAFVSEFLVWTLTDGGVTQTVWLRDAASGLEVFAERSGLYQAAGDHLWRWEMFEQPLVLCSIEDWNDSVGTCKRPHEQAVSAHRLVDLLDRTSAPSPPAISPPAPQPTISPPAPQPAISPPASAAAIPAPASAAEGSSSAIESANPVAAPDPDTLSLCEIDRSYLPLAGVGSYLFVTGSTYEYWCGAAHGFARMEFLVYDLASGSLTNLFTEAEESEVRRLGETKALSLLEAGESPPFSDRPLLTMVLPSYDPSGSLELRYQFTFEDCYACSDGLWDSYTRSVRMAAPSLPLALQPYSGLPRVVQGTLAGRPTPVAAFGWSRINPDPSVRDRLLQIFLGETEQPPNDVQIEGQR